MSLKDKIVITELPIGMWTSNYKEFLDSVTVDKRDKKAKGKFVLDYQDHSTDETVKFIIHMNSQVSQYVIYNEKIHMDSIEKMFKLTTTKSSRIFTYTMKKERFNVTKQLIRFSMSITLSGSQNFTNKENTINYKIWID